MRFSEQANEIFGALAIVNETLENPKHNAEVSAGKAGKYSHADLSIISETVRKALAKECVCINQSVKDNQILTLLGHKSGQWLETSFPFYCNATLGKEIGSWTTYMRKYSLCMTVCIYGDKDRDTDSTDGHGNDLHLEARDPSQPSWPPKKAANPPQQEPVSKIEDCGLALMNGVEITPDQVREWKVDFEVFPDTLIYKYIENMAAKSNKPFDYCVSCCMASQEKFMRGFENYKAAQ
jgi:hypothetical protein